jgi:hypothetical protein
VAAAEIAVAYVEQNALTMQDYAARDTLLRYTASFCARAAAAACLREHAGPDIAALAAALNRVRALQVRLDPARRRSAMPVVGVAGTAAAVAATAAIHGPAVEAPAPSGPLAEEWVVRVAGARLAQGEAAAAVYDVRAGLAAAGAVVTAADASALVVSASKRDAHSRLLAGDTNTAGATAFLVNVM